MRGKKIVQELVRTATDACSIFSNISMILLLGVGVQGITPSIFTGNCKLQFISLTHAGCDLARAMRELTHPWAI